MYTLLNLVFPHIFVDTSAMNRLLIIFLQIVIVFLLWQQRQASKLFEVYVITRNEMGLWLSARKKGLHGISINTDEHAVNYEAHRRSAKQLYKRITKLL